jgi:hypothetical protein
MEQKLCSFYPTVVIFRPIKIPDVKLKLRYLSPAVVIFRPKWKKCLDRELKFCSIYLAVVIFRPV